MLRRHVNDALTDLTGKSVRLVRGGLQSPQIAGRPNLSFDADLAV
jgi:hypothetical protein